MSQNQEANPITPITGNIQQLHHESQVSLTQGIRNADRITILERQLATLTESLNATLELVKTQNESQTRQLSSLDKACSSMLKGKNSLVTSLKDQNSGDSDSVDSDGDVQMKLFDVPQNHLHGGDSFKGKDTDVERFRTMCDRQFSFYNAFCSEEKKRVEFIEAHLGPATEWYHSVLGEEQIKKPNSKKILDELSAYYFTDLPEALKLRKLRKLQHKWGNSVDFVAKFKLYSKSLDIPEIIQLQFFEEQVQPQVRKRLLDVDPSKRSIELYYKMLVNYDCNRERYWDSDKSVKDMGEGSKFNFKKRDKRWNSKGNKNAADYKNYSEVKN